MPNQYDIIYQGRRLALAYVSPHPEYANHIVVSVIPLNRKGKWEDSTSELIFESPLHDIFPDVKPEIEAITEVVALAEIEPQKIEIKTSN